MATYNVFSAEKILFYYWVPQQEQGEIMLKYMMQPKGKECSKPTIIYR